MATAESDPPAAPARVGLRAGGGVCPYGITSPGVVGQGTGSFLSSAVAARAHERAKT